MRLVKVKARVGRDIIVGRYVIFLGNAISLKVLEKAGIKGKEGERKEKAKERILERGENKCTLERGKGPRCKLKRLQNQKGRYS